MLNKIDFSPGKITYDSFDINLNLSLEQQTDSLREDLFQVSYDEKYVIDVGWLPDFDPKGKFIIRIIKDYDWAKPVYKKRTKNLKTLNKCVEECAEIVRQLISTK